ncbi:unnamed protein product [Zymoseptoria tritici ST99CH_3D1]|nr:unnamed protein product [Zymoseptoria tritici ST99CH_3D1]
MHFFKPTIILLSLMSTVLGKWPPPTCYTKQPGFPYGSCAQDQGDLGIHQLGCRDKNPCKGSQHRCSFAEKNGDAICY